MKKKQNKAKNCADSKIKIQTRLNTISLYSSFEIHMTRNPKYMIKNF